MKRLLVVWLILFALLAGPALASDITAAKFRGIISVSNNSTAATNVATVGNISTSAFIGSGYLNATATDATIRNTSGVDVAFQLGYAGNQWAIFVPSIGADAYLSYLLYTGNVTGGKIRYFPAAGGMTTADLPTLELGGNFTITQKGLVDTTAGSNKFLVNKPNAVSVYADTATTGTIKASIGQSDNALAQVIYGGDVDQIAATTTEYNVLMGGGVWTATENLTYQVMPTAGTISNLYVRTSANIAAGTAIFTLMKNGAPQALTVTINAGASTGSDLTNSASFVAGDTVSLRYVTSGASGTPSVQWTTLWTSSVANESIMLLSGNAQGALTWYHSLQGSSNGDTTLPNNPMPTAGTFKKLYVQLDVDPGVAPDAYSFTLRKNNVAQALTTTITADATTGNDTVNTVAVVAGDLMDIAIVPLNVPAAVPIAAIGMVFQSTVVGESVVFGGSWGNSPATGATNYHFLVGGADQTWNATEANRYQLTQLTVLSKLYVKLNTAPDNGAGVQSYTISVREAVGNTGLTVTVAEAATTGNDVANTYTSANGAVTNIRSTPAGTPAAASVHWGLVSRYPGTTVSVSGITPTAGEKTVTVKADGTNFGIFIDAPTGIILVNPSFEIGDPPTNWTTSAVTAARNAAIFKIGAYSVYLTGTAGQYYQDIANPSTYGGKTLTLGAWVYSAFANTGRIGIVDDILGVTTYSTYHPGDSTWRWITVTATIGAGVPTIVRMQMWKSAAAPNTVYFDGAILVEGTTVPQTPPMPDGIALGGASVPDNANSWTFLQNNVMPYMESQDITIGGTQRQYVVWEYGATFNDQSPGGLHDVTPTFRNSSSDPDVKATLTSFGPVAESKAPAYSAGAGGTLITTVHNVTGLFSGGVATNVTIPGAQVVEDASTASGTPSQLPFTILSAFVLLTIWLTMGWLLRRFGVGHGGMFFKILVTSAVIGFFVATNVMDFWQLIFWLILALALAMASQHTGFSGVTSELNLIGFLAMAFVGMTLVNRVLEGSFITSSDVGIINTLTWTKDQIIFGTFSIPVPNTDFFFVGLPRLVKWDYAFFGGNAGLLQYFLYSFTAVVSFMAFSFVVGLLAQYFLRTR